MASLGKPCDAKRRSSGQIFLSYPHTHDRFLYSSVGKEQTLKEVITEHSYPVDVKFSKDQEFDVGGSTTSANRFPQLTLIDEFDEVYFLANTIIDG